MLEWCSHERVAAIPFGGGTSVVGGVTPQVSSRYNGAVSIDLRELDRVLEVDEVSRAARIQAGALGPQLEAQLGERGFTLRHFPQSFEYSTLGGWIATRAGGHFATLWTHIEDFVESVRAITPAGVWESRRLPGSGAGVSPDRMLAGSEGTLGVITQAWMRVQPRPSHRASAGVRFPSFLTGAECVRAISQSGLHPSNCRLLDAGEAALTMAGDGSHALLVLGFESADHPVQEAMARALHLCAEHGGAVPERRGPSAGASGAGGSGGDASSRASSGGGGSSGAGAGDGDAVGAWRAAFLGAPYVRDALVAMGVLAETFETAITWDRFAAFHERVSAATREAAHEVCGEGARVFCRFTHVYPDGAGALFHRARPRAPRRGGRAVDGDQAGRIGRDPRRGRHDHPPSRRRARPSAVV